MLQASTTMKASTTTKATNSAPSKTTATTQSRVRPMLIATHALQVGYDRRSLLPPFDLRVEAGQIWAVIGRNGGGKSTVLKTLLGLLPPVDGRIERAAETRMAYVPQREDRDGGMPGRVIDFVRAGLDRRWSFLKPRSRADAAAVERSMAQTKTLALAKQTFETLSEGQKQRVLVARALASDPQIMLLDEPSSAMDPIHEEALFDLLHTLSHARNLAIVVVSHQLSFIPRFATHMMLVDKDDAVVEIGDRAAVLTCDACRRKYGNLLPEAIPSPEATAPHA